MGGRSVFLRYARAAAFLLGLLVLMLSAMTSAVTARDKQVANQDNALGLTLRQQVQALEDYFERARAINAVLADSPVFTDFYQVAGTTEQKIAKGGPLLDRVNEALAYLEELFPGRVGEACFIDSSGVEIARVVNGTPATAAELSQDEDDNAFFAPTLALQPGQVYQAKEYESPDTHNAVISNSSPITAAGHTGIVHYEIALDSFRLTETTGGLAASIIDASSGRVIVDSRTATTTAGNGDRTFTPLIKGADQGVTTLGSRRVAFQRIAANDGNANDWYVAVSTPAFGIGWTRGLGVGSLALLLGALLITLVSGVSGWVYLRSVRRTASYDALTGLANRNLLHERAEAALRGGRPAALLVVDLQGFRDVNDVLGFRHGDLLLIAVAQRLSQVLPPQATVARIGSDDFAILLPGTDLAAARPVADAVLAALHRTYLVDGINLDMEASVGLAAGPEHCPDARTLLRHADTAMHLAKHHTSGVQEYDPAGDKSALHRLEVLGDLRRAIETDDQISLHYQPKIELATGLLTGVEALIRWNHPRLGLMAPDSFIPNAETTSLIRPLTTHVLDIAIRQAKTWQLQGRPIPVAVNLSTRCLLDADFADKVFDRLRQAGLPPSLLELEVTESMVMADPDRALAVLHNLHDGGIRLSIDDFGTGHSSMAYLQRLPVDELKIDRSFVQAMAGARDNSVLVRTTISLGHNLGLSVVAEGVEDAGTAAALRDLGCHSAQGYYFARPMPAAQVDTWLAASHVDIREAGAVTTQSSA